MKVKNGNLPETHYNICPTAVVEEPENMSFRNFLGNVHSILCQMNWIMIATCIWGCNTINFMKDEEIAKMEKKSTKILKMEKNLWSKNLYNKHQLLREYDGRKGKWKHRSFGGGSNIGLGKKCKICKKFVILRCFFDVFRPFGPNFEQEYVAGGPKDLVYH